MEREIELVLVVEADPPVRELLSDVLSDEGYEVLTAYDGEDARKLFASCRVDVVAIDLDTPGVSVGKLVREMLGAATELCVVALSSTQPPGRGSRWAHAVLSKPFDVDDLVEAVQRVLSTRRASSCSGRALPGRRSGRGRAYGAPEYPVKVSLGAGS